MTVPPHRDLPSGRLEARRRHLLAEIRRQPHSSRPRAVVLAAGMAAVAAAIAVPLSVEGSPKPRVEVVYRPVRLIVMPPSRLDTSSALTSESAQAQSRGGSFFGRIVAGLRAEGIRVRSAPHARPAVRKATALAAIRPSLSVAGVKAMHAWPVRKKSGADEHLVWLFAAPNACVSSYGPVGGVYRTTLVGFVDASTGRPLFAITLGGSRLRARC